MTDLELNILCVIQEAGNQPPEGQGGVSLVIDNRTRLHYNSNGTVIGTIEGHDQFSWVTHAFANGHYETVAKDGAQTAARVATLLAQAKAHTPSWNIAAAIVAQVDAGTFHGPLYDRLTKLTVLYDNLALAQPDWARTAREIVKIGAHSFYEDPAHTSVGRPNEAPAATGEAPIVARPLTVDV
jgi:spore germination cell wall hydrolase CwlJ-like protein